MKVCILLCNCYIYLLFLLLTDMVILNTLYHNRSEHLFGFVPLVIALGAGCSLTNSLIL